MEKVWDELKKIESQAEKIRSEAQNKAKTLTDLSQREAGQLVANSKSYAEEEAQRLHTSIIEEANRYRDEQLKANLQATEKLRTRAKKRIEHASSTVVKAVLGETKP
jgi:vacuolar-type H+-ATPase subunit E/Vma4